MSVVSRTLLVVCSGCAVLAACGAARSGAATPATDVSVTHSGDTTVVTIEDHSVEPENRDCKAYCDRLTACWYAVPNVDPMLAPKDVFARCWAEQHQCKTAVTEVHCCASISTCSEFVKCENSARDVVTECRPGGVAATTP